MSITAMKEMANYIDALGGDSKKYRQAIEQSEQEQNKQEPVYLIWFEGSQKGGWIEVEKHKYDKTDEEDRWLLYTTPPAAPVQEPVALKPCWYESKEKTMCRKCGQVHAEAIYTTPQPQQWVGLTDEDIEQEFGFIDELLRDCVYRTEAKLKEKNTL
jgi:hypothetical protein